MIGLHLTREILFKHLVASYLVMPETKRCLTADLYCRLSIRSAVEPCLCPPVDTTLVGIYTDLSRDVKALYIDVQVSKRVDNALFLYRVSL